MARVMAEKSVNGGAIRHVSKRKSVRGAAGFSRTAMLGVGLAIGGWVAGGFAAMQGIALSMQERSLDAPLVRQEARAASLPDGLRMVRSVKFKRISPADEKAERLAHADLAHRAVNRPTGDLVRERLQAAFRVDAENRRVAELLNKRPEAETIRTALASALSETMVLAPRAEIAWNEEMPAAPVEVAAIDMDAVKAIESVVVEETVAEAETGRLPLSGPLPVRRPVAVASLAPAAAAKPARPAKPVVAEQEEAPAPQALAFARPDNPVKSIGRSVPWPDRGTKIAVYDISNGVVHMPNGEKLEAHSGIGEMRDNPKFTHVKMRGPTPPGTYKLSMREKLFHGVAAIRLNPIDGVAPKGRTGLLAHSYLLARKGDSHGCVAFANYDRFLKAFRRGEITHMVIVERHDGRKPTLAVAKGDDKPRKTLIDYMRGND